MRKDQYARRREARAKNRRHRGREHRMKMFSWRETEEKAKPMRRDGGGKDSEEESGRQSSRQSHGKG